MFRTLQEIIFFVTSLLKSSRRCHSEVFKTLQIWHLLPQVVTTSGLVVGRLDLFMTSWRRRNVCVCWVRFIISQIAVYWLVELQLTESLLRGSPSASPHFRITPIRVVCPLEYANYCLVHADPVIVTAD